MTTPNPIPTQVIEKWREEFERECIYSDHWLQREEEYGDYIRMEVEAQWQGFLLARSTVDIELPKESHQNWEFDDGRNQGIRDCVNYIEEQGYRVAGEK